jgi:hypothetical protein
MAATRATNRSTLEVSMNGALMEWSQALQQCIELATGSNAS